MNDDFDDLENNIIWCDGAVIMGDDHPCGKYTKKLIYKSIWGVESRGLCEDCFQEHGGEEEDY